MIPTLETRRLILRPLTLADADRTQQLFPQWEIVKHLANRFPWPFPPDGVITYYRDMALPAMAHGDEWHWTLRLKIDPAEHIGCIALSKGETGNRGFWLGLPWHRQGLMSEAVDTVNDFWFNTLGFPEMRVQKAIANTGSRRISEKNGMHIIETKESDYISGRLPTEIWAITAEEWRRHRATP
jgi:ribosomal-protein-alanine N-acetyltransferase